MAACATLLPGETKQVQVKLDSGESGVTFATVDSVDKLTIRAALYETSIALTDNRWNNRPQNLGDAQRRRTHLVNADSTGWTPFRS